MTRAHGSSSVYLKPEQKRAVRFLIDFLESWDYVSLPSVPEMDQILQTGNVSVVDGIITSKKIPSEESWFWNQTTSSHSVVIPTPERFKYVVVFRKLNCRSKKNTVNTSVPLPKHKLWLYDITLPSRKAINIIWCEKGITPTTDPDVNPDVFINWDGFANLQPHY